MSWLAETSQAAASTNPVTHRDTLYRSTSVSVEREKDHCTAGRWLHLVHFTLICQKQCHQEQRRLMKHLFSGNVEISWCSTVVWNDRCWAPGHWDCPVVNSRPSDLRQRRPDDREYWAGDVVLSGDVDWQSADVVGWQCLRLQCAAQSTRCLWALSCNDKMWYEDHYVYAETLTGL